jgi:hypothetical protein
MHPKLADELRRAEMARLRRDREYRHKVAKWVGRARWAGYVLLSLACSAIVAAIVAGGLDPVP